MITCDDEVPCFSNCPICGEKGLDVLSTHSHCVNCLYSPDLHYRYEEDLIPQWALPICQEIKLPSLSIQPEPSPEAVEAS